MAYDSDFDYDSVLLSEEPLRSGVSDDEDTDPLFGNLAFDAQQPTSPVPDDDAPFGPLTAQAQPDDMPNNVAPAADLATGHAFGLMVDPKLASWDRPIARGPPYEMDDATWLHFNPQYEQLHPFAGPDPAAGPIVQQAPPQQQPFLAPAPAVHAPPPQQQQQQPALIAQGAVLPQPGRSDGAEGEHGQERNDYRERNGKPRRGRPRKGEERPPKPPIGDKRPRKDRDGPVFGSAGGAAGGITA